MPDQLEVEHQAQKIMSKPMVVLIKNIRARLFKNWGFGIIFFERSHSTSPSVFVCSGCDRREFVEIADRFARSAKKGKG